MTRQRNKTDFTGQQFGELTVQREASSIYPLGVWECVCSCGNVVRKTATQLKKAKSCGCRALVRTGKKAATRKRPAKTRLTIIGPSDEYITKPSGKRARLWDVSCQCSHEYRLEYSVAVRRTACGNCWYEARYDNHKLSESEAGYRRTLRTYIKSAEQRQLAFEITSDEFRDLIQRDCAYCGIPASRNVTSGVSDKARTHAAFRCNGIDRIDNCRGYVVGNVVPCCSACNYAKRDRDHSEFVQWIARAYLHLSGGKGGE